MLTKKKNKWTPTDQKWFEYGVRIGIATGEETDYERKKFISYEAWSRFVARKSLRALDPYLPITQMPLSGRCDFLIESGGTEVMVEAKAREKKYSDSRISYKKGCFIENALGYLVVYYEDTDEFYVWDLKEYKPRFIQHWMHKEKTAVDAEYIDEPAWAFDYKYAKFKGKANI